MYWLKPELSEHGIKNSIEMETKVLQIIKLLWNNFWSNKIIHCMKSQNNYVKHFVNEKNLRMLKWKISDILDIFFWKKCFAVAKV